MQYPALPDGWYLPVCVVSRLARTHKSCVFLGRGVTLILLTLKKQETLSNGLITQRCFLSLHEGLLLWSVCSCSRLSRYWGRETWFLDSLLFFLPWPQFQRGVCLSKPQPTPAGAVDFHCDPGNSIRLHEDWRKTDLQAVIGSIMHGSVFLATDQLPVKLWPDYFSIHTVSFTHRHCNVIRI